MSEKNSKRIILGSDGNPRKQAARNPYSPSSDSRPVRRNPPKPYLAHGIHKKAGFIKTGQLSAGTSSGASAGGGPVQSMAQSPLYYDYRWSTPDKFYFPRNRVVANSIWRQVYIRDATIAVATDMYSELPWSGFDLIGIDDASIKKTYEDMFNELDIVPKMTDFTRDFLILGEVILHSIFNSRKGYWERVISHNPDYVRVEGVGLVTEQPLMWMRPTPEIKRLLGSPDKRVRKLQQIIPREMLNAFRRNQEVPLDDLNTTFLARKVNSTDVRGTSLYTRLYRTIMYEDFVVNASLAVSQRMAAPLRIFKLGDPQTGWLPDANDEAEFAEMLSMAESDPLACIVTHNNVSVDLVGVADRALLISKEWDFLERIKLLAMGVAKSFLLGEASFASAIAGIQMLLERVLVLRNMFENTWINKKLCQPVAEMNDFYKRPKSELDHRIRVKTKDEMEQIVPTIKWKKSLDPAQDTAILGIWRDLKERGILSDRTYASGANVDIDVERKNQKEEKTYVEEHPDLFGIPEAPAGGGMAPGGKPPAGGKPQGPGGKPPPSGGGMPPPMPLPGGSKNLKKTGTATDSLYYSVEEELLDLADKKGNVNVEDAMEIFEDIIEKKAEIKKVLDKAEHSSTARKEKNLLVGKSIG